MLLDRLQYGNVVCELMDQRGTKGKVGWFSQDRRNKKAFSTTPKLYSNIGGSLGGKRFKIRDLDII